MPRRAQSLDELEYKVLILGGFGDGVPHREATHLAGSRGGRTALLIATTILRISLNRIGGTSAVK